MKERQSYKTTDYDPDEITLLLELISADNYETILNPEDYYYFEYVSLGLISAGMGKVNLKYSRKIPWFWSTQEICHSTRKKSI